MIRYKLKWIRKGQKSVNVNSDKSFKKKSKTTKCITGEISEKIIKCNEVTIRDRQVNNYYGYRFGWVKVKDDSRKKNLYLVW